MARRKKDNKLAGYALIAVALYLFLNRKTATASPSSYSSSRWSDLTTISYPDFNIGVNVNPTTTGNPTMTNNPTMPTQNENDMVEDYNEFFTGFNLNPTTTNNPTRPDVFAQDKLTVRNSSPWATREDMMPGYAWMGENPLVID